MSAENINSCAYNSGKHLMYHGLYNTFRSMVKPTAVNVSRKWMVYPNRHPNTHFRPHANKNGTNRTDAYAE